MCWSQCELCFFDVIFSHSRPLVLCVRKNKQCEQDRIVGHKALVSTQSNVFAQLLTGSKNNDVHTVSCTIMLTQNNPNRTTLKATLHKLVGRAAMYSSCNISLMLLHIHFKLIHAKTWLYSRHASCMFWYSEGLSEFFVVAPEKIQLHWKTFRFKDLVQFEMFLNYLKCFGNAVQQKISITPSILYYGQQMLFQMVNEE